MCCSITNSVIIVGDISSVDLLCSCFFFQAEDGIRDLVRSRGLGDVYKRQGQQRRASQYEIRCPKVGKFLLAKNGLSNVFWGQCLSLIHI